MNKTRHGRYLGKLKDLLPEMNMEGVFDNINLLDPERKLWVAVLFQTLEDWKIMTRYDRNLWLTGDHVGSLEYICSVMGWKYKHVYRQLVGRLIKFSVA